MTKEGRIQRGEENYKANKFLENSETLEYMATLKKPEVKKDAKPTK